MVRSRLRNKFLKDKTLESRDSYRRQRNYCVFLLTARKKSFYENLDPNLLTDNRTFWKQVKPFFSDKTPLIVPSWKEMKSSLTIILVRKF